LVRTRNSLVNLVGVVVGTVGVLAQAALRVTPELELLGEVFPVSSAGAVTSKTFEIPTRSSSSRVAQNARGGELWPSVTVGFDFAD
jgi:hypothetical protein|tara:strand:- start:18 stop:275 length:258 start_codon:yes stop_codon:yes gene_type:complete